MDNLQFNNFLIEEVIRHLTKSNLVKEVDYEMIDKVINIVINNIKSGIEISHKDVHYFIKKIIFNTCKYNLGNYKTCTQINYVNKNKLVNSLCNYFDEDKCNDIKKLININNDNIILSGVYNNTDSKIQNQKYNYDDKSLNDRSSSLNKSQIKSQNNFNIDSKKNSKYDLSKLFDSKQENLKLDNDEQNKSNVENINKNVNKINNILSNSIGGDEDYLNLYKKYKFKYLKLKNSIK